MTPHWLLILAAVALGAVCALGVARVTIAISHAVTCDGPTSELFTPCREESR